MKVLRNIAIAGFIAGAMSSCTVILPVTASKAEIGELRGTSESIVLFQTIYLNKNYGLQEAAKKGKITSAIATIDEKTTNYLIFSKKELIVTAK
ncbi:MAG: TRL-like family protein [Cryomorphaceae bacterium]|jgi:hypothetical protein|nr:TRL-like family protein [Cryomorphaceae bacterium]